MKQKSDLNRGRSVAARAATGVDKQYPTRERGRDLYLGIGILLVSAVLWYITTHFRTAPVGLSQNVPATMFPRLLLATASILAVVLIAQGWKHRPENSSLPGTRVWLTGAVLASILFLIEWIGVLATIAAAGFTIPILWGERRYVVVAIYASLLCLAIYVLFTLVMGVHFPAGLFTE